MNMGIIAGVTVIAAIIAVLIKQYNPEYAMVVSLSAGIILLGYCLINAVPVINDLHNILSKTGAASQYTVALLKAIGICYITQMAAEACIDAGENSLASKAEIGGRIALLIIAMPLISDIAQMAMSFLD